MNLFGFVTPPVPITLRPVSPEALGSAAHVWLSMSAGCALRYDAVLASYRHKNEVEDMGSSFSVLLGTYENRLRRTFLLGPSADHIISSQFEYNVVSMKEGVCFCFIIDVVVVVEVIIIYILIPILFLATMR